MSSAVKKLLPAVLLLWICGSYAPPPTNAESSSEEISFILIVHPSNTTSGMTRRDISRLFLKKTDWPDGQAADPAEQAGKDLSDAFSRAIHGRSAFSVRAEWKKRLFAGQGVPPPRFKTDQEVLQYVREHPGGIGYISAETQPEGVKSLRVTG